MNLSQRSLFSCLRRTILVAMAAIGMASLSSGQAFELLYELSSPTSPPNNFGSQVVLSNDHQLQDGGPLVVGSDDGYYLYAATKGTFIGGFPNNTQGTNLLDSIGLGTNKVAITQTTGGLGSVEVYDINAGSNVTLTPLDRVEPIGFGFALDTNDSIVAVGAPLDNALDGAVYIFDPNTGDQLTKLESTGTIAPGGLGGVLALGQNWLAVRDNWLSNSSGEVRVYDTKTFQEQTVLQTVDSDDSFGFNIAVHGDYVISGAPSFEDQSGKAYVHSADTGQLISELIPTAATAVSDFGRSVSIHGNLAIVGATGLMDEVAAAFIFDVRTGTQLAHFADPTTGTPLSSFAETVAINGQLAAVGNSSENVVYVYQVPEPGISIAMLSFLLLAFRSTEFIPLNGKSGI